MYEERTYRGKVRADDLVPFTVVVKETDLFVLADSDLAVFTTDTVINLRHGLEGYIKKYNSFLGSLTPVKAASGAPEIVRRMCAAGQAAGVGPMAAVAGAVSEMVGEALLKLSTQAIVENGGDIFIKSDRPRVIAVHAGDSPLSDRVGVRVNPADTPLGVCTSSGKVGHSMSLGQAHAACIISRSAALADAAATAVGNVVKGSRDIEKALGSARAIEGVEGAVVIAGDRLGAWGRVELVRL